MSIQTELSTLSKTVLKNIEDDIKICITSKYTPKGKTIYCYKIHEKQTKTDKNKVENSKQTQKIPNENKILYIPFDTALNHSILPKTRNSFSKTSIKILPTFRLRDYQIEDKNQALDFLNKRGNCILSLYTGYGKTKLSIYLSIKLGLKTIFICKNVTILSQIKSAIEEMCDAKIEKIEPKNYKEKNCFKDADIYLINPINIPKFPYHWYNDIGTVIADECHQIAAEKLSGCFNYLSPRYLIGLSATPYREDGCDKILDIYFGKNRIIKDMKRTHKYHSIFTGKKYVFNTNSQGRVDWGDALMQLSSDRERNDNICKLINILSDKTVIVFCKRKSQADYIYKTLKEEYNENVDLYYGSDKTYDKNCRILVSINSKAGVGFDDPRIDTLVLAADVQQYYQQILGRVFRREDTIPEIFDIIDDNGLLKKHYYTRKSVSQSVNTDDGEYITYKGWSEILEEHNGE